ncbi:MAG: DUF1990 family protein [Bacteroidetes bacterium]|nr:DUF1990 family protein [Bacteroidota bacterium]
MNKIIHEPTRIGIIYVILNGHVEKGISIFTIEQNADQNTIFKIHTYSSPGSILLKLFVSFPKFRPFRVRV